MSATNTHLRALVTALALTIASPLFAADGGIWSVSKSSGEVWFTSGDVQQASMKPEQNLKPGDTIRTGRNGRVLLVRGEESVLIAPNSVVGLPVEATEGLSTTIVQRAGSILLEVEKRNVKHFEVETPYLAAVVKGTRFRVTVNSTNTSVDVIRGQVEVDDFKSGQIAQIMPGQRATAFEHGKSGLLLSGTGTFNPIERGKPRPSALRAGAGPEERLICTARRCEQTALSHVGRHRPLRQQAHGAWRLAPFGSAWRRQTELPQGYPRPCPRYGTCQRCRTQQQHCLEPIRVVFRPP